MYSYQFNLKDFKVYQSAEELLLKVVAGEDYDEERVKVMALYRDTDLQQYKLESQLSLLPEKVQSMIMGSTSLICWTFFSHSEAYACHTSYQCRHWAAAETVEIELRFQIFPV